MSDEGISAGFDDSGIEWQRSASPGVSFEGWHDGERIVTVENTVVPGGSNRRIISRVEIMSRTGGTGEFCSSVENANGYSERGAQRVGQVHARREIIKARAEWDGDTSASRLIERGSGREVARVSLNTDGYHWITWSGADQIHRRGVSRTFTLAIGEACKYAILPRRSDPVPIHSTPDPAETVDDGVRVDLDLLETTSREFDGL